MLPNFIKWREVLFIIHSYRFEYQTIIMKKNFKNLSWPIGINVDMTGTDLYGMRLTKKY